MLATLLVILTIGLLYAFVIRDWFGRWGTTPDERTRIMAGDKVIAKPTHVQTCAVTIHAPPEDIWPWLVQIGSQRGGLYSYDWLDRLLGFLDQPSANRVLPEFQHLAVGDTILFGREKLTVAGIEPPQALVLSYNARGVDWVWQFGLYPLDGNRTRFVERGTERFPRTILGWLGMRVMEPAGFIMTRRFMLGVKKRAEAMRQRRSGFKSPEGEAAFRAAYDAVLEQWQAPYEELDVPTRFGNTHVIVSGPKDAPPLVLLHGIYATSTMWKPNIADFAKEHRVYAIDVMGQPSKSTPTEPIRSAADHVTWLTMTLDALRIVRAPLVGVSYGGWLAGAYAISKPERVEKLALLSTGGLLPLTKEFTIRGMLMVLVPTRFTVKWCMHWLGIRDEDFIGVMYLGLKHFRIPSETARAAPAIFSDEALRAMRVPTLVLYGDREVICDPAAALARARRLIPDVEGDLIPGCSHDMCGTKFREVDARVLNFLSKRTARAKPAA